METRTQIRWMVRPDYPRLAELEARQQERRWSVELWRKHLWAGNHVPLLSESEDGDLKAAILYELKKQARLHIVRLIGDDDGKAVLCRRRLSKTDGLGWKFLTVDVPAGDKDALAFYRRHDFRGVETFTEAFHGELTLRLAKKQETPC